MEYEYLYQYFERLSWPKLVSDNRWLLVGLVASWYCETAGVKYIHFYALKSMCSKVLRRLTPDASSFSSGTLESILKSRRGKKILKKRIREVKGRAGKLNRETRIFPNTPLIKREYEIIKREDLESTDAQIRVLKKYTGIVSDELHGVVTKAETGKVKRI